MNFSWNKIKKPIICLAPMAGFTDSAFRQITKILAPEIVCFSELTSINAIAHNSEKTLKMLQFSDQEQPLIMQFFGNDVDFFVKSAKVLEKSKKSAGIDINMGCPAPKVTKNQYGSALLESPDKAAKIIETLSKNTSLPISAKIRIGYQSYDEKKFKKIITTLESAGLKSLTIHGRTTKQGYSGKADFSPIYLAKEILKIPVIGNGDIISVKDASEKITSPDKKITLDGLMIGRATIGNPWILKDIYQHFHGRSKTPKSLSFEEKLPTIKKHFKLAIKLHGEKIGLLEMRKHLGGYISNTPNASIYRSQIFKEENSEKILELLDSLAKN